MPWAADASPLAFSSITRSIIEAAKVTPAALITCKSTGESNQGEDFLQRLGSALAIIVATDPNFLPLARFNAAAGFLASHRSRIVGKLREISISISPSSFTTAGPTLGNHTLPARTALEGKSDMG